MKYVLFCVGVGEYMLCMSTRGRGISQVRYKVDPRIHRCRVQGVVYMGAVFCSLSPQHSFTFAFLLLPHLKAAWVQDVNMTTFPSSAIS